MKLFDKKYVYFMWDDILKDKGVLVEDDIYNLEREVNDGDDGFFEVVKSDNYSEPFRIDYDNVTYRFAYYDPNYLCKIAYYNEGKTVQVKDSKGWLDWVLDAEPVWDSGEFRIKPEEPKYRPFKDTKELIDYWQLNYNPGAASRPQYSKPIIWIRKLEDCVTYSTDYMITGIDKYTVFIEDMWIELKELFERGYTFLDDKPFGIKE